MVTKTAKTSVGKRSEERNAPKASEIESPVDLSNLTPASFGVKIESTGETREDVVFSVDEEVVSKLHFQNPGASLPSKRLFTVKAFTPSGVLVQLPFEDQIQNTKASSRQDAIGLRRYENKGFKVLYDYEQGLPIYCAAWGCWAQARPNDSFCCDPHRLSTVPTRGGNDGMFSAGVTGTASVYR